MFGYMSQVGGIEQDSNAGLFSSKAYLSFNTNDQKSVQNPATLEFQVISSRQTSGYSLHWVLNQLLPLALKQ